MYLVDTSVWVALFRQRDGQAVRFFRRLVENDMPFGLTGVIYQELLQGAKGERDFRDLRIWLGSQTFYHPKDERETYAGAARMYYECRRRGVTIRSTVDCLIARIALEHDLVLLHDDADFDRLASVVEGLKVSSGEM